MSAADAPDYVRAATATQRLLGSFPAATTSATITLPSNVVALWFLLGPSPSAPPLTVVGVTTGLDYPVYQIPLDATGGAFVPSLALVAPEVDSQVVVTWNVGPGRHWYVIGDAGPRIAVDPILGASAGPPGVGAPGWGLQVAGTDGTDLRVLLTDASGHLLAVDQSLKNAIGAPAAAAPADALQIAGTDGTDLRVLLTDSSGRLETTDAAFPTVYGPPGGVPPADALQVAGTDGTHLRALATDLNGILIVGDVTLEQASNGVAGPIPPFAVQVGGSDGTDLRAMLTSKQGSQYVIATAPATDAGDHPPVELQFASINTNAASSTVVGAPGAGRRIRLFQLIASLGPTGGGSSFINVTDSVAGTLLAQAVATPQASSPICLSGYPTGIPLSANAAIAVANGPGANYYTVSAVYTVEAV